MGRAAQLEFLVLGPLEVRAAGIPLPLGGPKQRALLALLILNANRVVSRDRLVDELWADSGAADARHALDVQLSRVRRALRDQGDGETLLVTQAPGYALRLQPGQVDL